ncbi:hypothetical protein MSIMFB_00256 [Mycobacterium simulans]|uniref:Uncharacterized protein n=1 Tax=Mycobacterium simulans TaxID=627089 RepID=A0A7Z7IHQ5_9MYCO|nr:hypothetical protein MSIMFB_00256 [Mycobacterium simulans]SON59516.1 hypothetical protein MSIMFI_01000 [Mycobacterium simulans]
MLHLTTHECPPIGGQHDYRCQGFRIHPHCLLFEQRRSRKEVSNMSHELLFTENEATYGFFVNQLGSDNVIE